MARSVNRVELIGNIGQDPEVRYNNSGKANARVSLATSSRYKSGDGYQERTEWHRVVFFDQLAEVIEKHTKKGTQVRVEGELRTTKYTGKDGIERYSTDVIARDLMILNGWRDADGDHGADHDKRPRQQSGQARSNGGGGRQRDGGYYDRSPQPQYEEHPLDDGIPF